MFQTESFKKTSQKSLLDNHSLDHKDNFQINYGVKVGNAKSQIEDEDFESLEDLNLLKSEKQKFLDKYSINIDLPYPTITLLFVNYCLPNDINDDKSMILHQETDMEIQGGFQVIKELVFQGKRSMILLSIENIKGQTAFSENGEFLAYIPANEPQVLNIVDSRTFENLQDIKFVPFKKTVSLVYLKRVEFYDFQMENFTLQDALQQRKILNISDTYIGILCLQFKQEKSDQNEGKIALKTYDPDRSQPIIHFFSFINDKIVYSLKNIRVVKFDQLGEQIPQKFIVKITQDMKDAMISLILGKKDPHCLLERNQILTYQYKIESQILTQISQKRRVEKIITLGNFYETLPINNFVTLECTNQSEEYLVNFGEDQHIIFRLPQYSSKPDFITAFASVNQSDEIIVKFIVLRDQEKISHYSFTQVIKTAFDNMIRVHSVNIGGAEIDSNLQMLKQDSSMFNFDSADTFSELREYEEFVFSDLKYPFICHSDIKGNIKVNVMDNSQSSYIVPPPQITIEKRMKKLKMQGQQMLLILMEDDKFYYIYKLNLKERSYLNQQEFIIRLQKSYLQEGTIIEDFFLHSKLQNKAQKYLPIKSKGYSASFFYLSQPDYSLRVFYQIQNIPQHTLIARDVSNFRIVGDRLFYVHSQMYLESLDTLNFELEKIVHYEYLDGKIIKIIDCASSNTLALYMVSSQNQHLLKFYNLASQTTIIETMTITISNRYLINNLRLHNTGHIENSQDKQILLYSNGNQIFSINDKLPSSDNSYVFRDIFELDQDQSQIIGNLLFDRQSHRTMAIQKFKKIRYKKGVLLPSFLSYNSIKLQQNENGQFQNQRISFIINCKTISHNHNHQASHHHHHSEQEHHHKHGNHSNSNKSNHHHHSSNEKEMEEDLIGTFDLQEKSFLVQDLRGFQITKQELSDQIPNTFGKVKAISSKFSKILLHDQSKNLVNVFNLTLNVETKHLNVEAYGTLQLGQQASGKLSQVIIQSLERQAMIDTLHKEFFRINNNGDILHIQENGETLRKQFMIYSKHFDCKDEKYCQGIELNIDSKGMSNIKGFKLSNKYVLGWNDQVCYFYDIKQEQYGEVSLQFDKKDNIKIIEASHIESHHHGLLKKELFLLRLENSMQVQTIVLWDQISSSEQCSCDVSPLNQLLFDTQGHVYILDSNLGLIETLSNSGHARHLSFRKNVRLNNQNRDTSLIQSEDLDIGYKVKIVSLMNNNQKNFDRIRRQNTTENLSFHFEKITQKKYIDYIIVGNEVVLPHSYFQIILNDQIKDINEKDHQNQKKSQELMQIFLNKIQPLNFTYQVRNSNIFHIHANNFKELEIICEYFEKKQPLVLEFILVKNEDMKTPLDIALESRNNRSINLFMHYISLYCKETFGKSTNTLRQHFSDLLDSQNFPKLMEAALYQNHQLRLIHTISSKNEKRLEEKGIHIQHGTICKDKGFNEKFIDHSNLSERNVNVYAIRADWILLTKEGDDFLKKLSKSENLELFSLESIQTIVKFQWKIYKAAIIRKLFIPFLVYFIAFILSMTMLYQRVSSDEIEIIDDNNKLLNFILVVGVILPLQLYFLANELRQLINQGFKYFNEFWNYLDLFQLLLALYLSFIMLTQSPQVDSTRVNSVGAATVIFLYLKFFYFLRLFDKTAPFIRMVVQMAYDIRIFIYIFFLTIIGFGNGFYLLSISNRNEDDRFIKSFPMSIMFVYRMALGDFDTEKFGNESIYLVWFIFILSTMLIMILLLNLLIAIMGDSYGKVTQAEEQSKVQEYLQLLLDNSFLIDKQKIFDDVKFIICIKLDEDDDNLNTEQNNMMKKMLQNQELLMNTIQDVQKNQVSLREQFNREIIHRDKSNIIPQIIESQVTDNRPKTPKPNRTIRTNVKKIN
ncbi:wd-40 repeat protein [Stylonychia lemnae]|uniref:Wd-40 repeat protein n=1 Tax=Stylonychia lemnae TaxID=5949 RepID=A0A077ZUT0_STYLE|nr:wd-40 repeat protein [Stylonychia lemnae]|eukprot:CDW73665.1 wd-40 repeat protein [Stylonychia lemnae]